SLRTSVTSRAMVATEPRRLRKKSYRSPRPLGMSAAAQGHARRLQGSLAFSRTSRRVVCAWGAAATCQGTRLRFLVLFCYAERGSVFRNGKIGHSLELRIAKQCRGKKDNPATR